MTARLPPWREAEIRQHLADGVYGGDLSNPHELLSEIDALREDLRASNAVIAVLQAQAALDRAEIDRLRDTLTGLASDLSNVRG